MAAKKRATASKSTSRARAKTRRPSSTRDVDNDDDRDDDEDDDSLGVDEEIELFVRRPPAGAERLVVVAATHQGDSPVQDRLAGEARRAPVQLARSITESCERWAASEGRTVRFRATWLREDRVLAAHQWQVGDGRDPAALDGTVESFLGQQQRFAEAQHRLHLEGFEMVQESWKGLLTLANRRIEALERDNGELRDRLRRVDDVGSEIALEQARQEIEARGRTADILEKRLLPIAQHLMLRHADSQQPTAAAPEHKDEDDGAER